MINFNVKADISPYTKKSCEIALYHTDELEATFYADVKTKLS